MKNYFYIIGGIGHCGTKWLAEALNRPWDGMACSHELMVAKSGFKKKGWWPCAKFVMENGLDERFDPYFSYIDKVTKSSIFGDAHSWPTIIVPELVGARKVKRIIYLVRNGIQNVHSFDVHTSNINMAVNHGFFSKFVRREVELFGGPFEPQRPWKSLSRFHVICFWWASQIEAIEWIRKSNPGIKVEVVRLGDLVAPGRKDLFDLAKLISPSATADRLEDIKGKDINRKVSGDRNPKRLFSQVWEANEREAFKAICGPVMEEFKYAIP